MTSLRTPVPLWPLLSFRRALPALRLPSKRRRISTTLTASAPNPPFRVLLLGSDDLSCATLKALHEARDGLIDELTVVTPPEARTGRGLKTVHVPPLRLLAESLSIPALSLPRTGFKDWSIPDPFQTPSPSNLLLTASFGHLIPSSILNLFDPLNALNVHPSLLPRYRGAAPIQWTIINGDSETGVSVQELSRGTFDKGRILGQTQLSVPSNSDFASLEPVLAKAGGDLLVSILRNLAKTQANATTQDPSLASLAPKLTKETARISWSSQTPSQLDNLQRGVSHHFPLWTTLAPSHSPLQLVLSPSPPPSPTSEALLGMPCGSVELDSPSRSVLVRCAEGVVRVEKVRRAGGKWVEGREWWNGAWKGSLLSFE